MNALIEEAASLIAEADGLLITAGAGMGVDSGLPDFRGGEGFWAAYPALARSRIPFQKIANPHAFRNNPEQAWGFYGHRLALYRRTVPHSGFGILWDLAATKAHGAFVVTSNVDGQFQVAGFDPNRILEIHGSIHHLQCMEPCRDYVWSAADLHPDTDDDTCRWLGDLPHCPNCGGLARPNILMFDDWVWLSQREHLQEQNYHAWLQEVEHPVVIECGAGVSIPSIRYASQRPRSSIIRINPVHHELEAGRGISLAMGARAALEAIRDALRRLGQLVA